MPGPRPRPIARAQLAPVTLLCAAGSMKSRSGSTVSLPVTGAPKPTATASSATVATRTRRGCAVTRRAIAASMARGTVSNHSLTSQGQRWRAGAARVSRSRAGDAGLGDAGLQLVEPERVDRPERAAAAQAAAGGAIAPQASIAPVKS